jgi:hypothetical protein
VHGAGHIMPPIRKTHTDTTRSRSVVDCAMVIVKLLIAGARIAIAAGTCTTIPPVSFNASRAARGEVA